ncbi:MAG: hypothetical protein ACRDJH_19250 [Thermomicrobiales bacterium]
MHRGRSFEEPFGWWGPIWDTPLHRSLPELVGQGVLTAEVAALLATLVAKRASIVVAADSSGAGKTTLLTAILDYLPPGSGRVYIRGCYEPFDFLETTDPDTTALLVNEISGHLPFYLWGPAVRRVFDAARRGYQLAATVHASSVEDFVHSLVSYPLHVRVEEIQSVDILVLLDAWSDAGNVRRVVRSVMTLSTPAARDRIEPLKLVTWDEHAGELTISYDVARALYASLGGNPAQLQPLVKREASGLIASPISS